MVVLSIHPLMAMLRVHLMQNWFGYSDPVMEEALYETTILRQFSGLSLERILDETTILNFRRLLQKHDLATGILGVISRYLGDRGLSFRQGTIVDTTPFMPPARPRTWTASAIPRWTRRRKAISITSGPKPRSVSVQFAYAKVCFRGLVKTTAKMATLFALSSLWIARHSLANTGEVRV